MSTACSHIFATNTPSDQWNYWPDVQTHSPKDRRRWCWSPVTEADNPQV